MATVIDGSFEWDDDKATSNLTKHGISFAEGATVFADPLAVYLDDGSETDRVMVIGTSLRDRVLCVVHVNAVHVTGSSRCGWQLDQSAKFTKAELEHDPVLKKEASA